MIVSSRKLTRGVAVAAALWFSVATAAAQMATAQIVKPRKPFYPHSMRSSGKA